MKTSLVLAGLAITWLAIGAHTTLAGEQHGHGHAAESAEANATHTVRGIFLGYDEDAHRVTIAHEAIPEVMMAMRMRFSLAEGEPVPALSPGDKVAFQMFSRVEAGRTWHARELEALPAATELTLPEALREQIGH